MNIRSFTGTKAAPVEWVGGMQLQPGMTVRCHGNELFAVIAAASAANCEVPALQGGRKGNKSEWLATISAKRPEANG